MALTDKEQERATAHADNWEERFTKEFSHESDRAAVIISAAMLERALETLLKGRFVPITGPDDNLFDSPYAPISSFNAKIDIAYRMGLISIKMCRDLHLIRKIRNDFAHGISSCSFEDPGIRSRIIELNRSSNIISKYPEKRSEAPEGPRGDFQIAVAWMLYSLTADSVIVEPIESSGPELGYRPRSSE